MIPFSHFPKTFQPDGHRTSYFYGVLLGTISFHAWHVPWTMWGKRAEEETVLQRVTWPRSPCQSMLLEAQLLTESGCQRQDHSFPPCCGPPERMTVTDEPMYPTAHSQNPCKDTVTVSWGTSSMVKAPLISIKLLTQHLSEMVVLKEYVSFSR